MVAFKEAISDLVSIVYNAREKGLPLPNTHCFSYRLTKRQRDIIDKLCERHGWEKTDCRGVEINASTVNHILDSRLDQGVSFSFVIDILVAAYNEFSEIHVNLKYKIEENKEQAFFLNGIKKLNFNNASWNAVAVVAIDNVDQYGQRRLASITAYHADEAKVRKIKGLVKKPKKR